MIKYTIKLKYQPLTFRKEADSITRSHGFYIFIDKGKCEYIYFSDILWIGTEEKII
jgi:hypothetical protein